MLLGITFSELSELKKWADENGLTTDLLQDADRSVAMAYGAADSADQERATRRSFLVGPDGVIKQVWPEPQPSIHPEEALAALS